MDQRKKAEMFAADITKGYGHMAGALGDEDVPLDVIPTGILALDYALGTGGWPRRHPIEVFGAPDIGKSSILGLSAMRNAQAMGLSCAVIALEPGWDPKWAKKNGVDPSLVGLARPDNGEEAFQMLAKAVEASFEFILFDSIGAVLREAEAKEGASGPSAMGQSALITWGVKNILMKAWKRNLCIMFINQQRDDTKSRIAGMVESPGGWALKHGAAIRVHLKSGGSPYKAKIDGEDIEIGRSLVASIKRNKLSEGSKRRAEFDWYGIDTEHHPVGIDVATDVFNTAKRTQVLVRSGGWYSHSLFPADKKGEHKLQGEETVKQYLIDHPQVVTAIREEVLEVMEERLGKPKNIKPELEVIDGAS